MSWLGRLGRRPKPVVPVFADDDSLVILLTAADPAQADSAVLAQAAERGVDLTQALLLRQHLVLPDRAAVEVARELLGQDGYQLTVVGAASPDGPANLDGPALPLAVRAWRTQVVTAMSAAQERSRAAGLAQRLGGDVRGWDALGPADASGTGDALGTGDAQGTGDALEPAAGPGPGERPNLP